MSGSPILSGFQRHTLVVYPQISNEDPLGCRVLANEEKLLNREIIPCLLEPIRDYEESIIGNVLLAVKSSRCVEIVGYGPPTAFSYFFEDANFTKFDGVAAIL